MGGSPHMAIEMIGNSHQETLGPVTALADSYVPSEAGVIHLADTETVHPGDMFQSVKPVTSGWVHFME